MALESKLDVLILLTALLLISFEFERDEDISRQFFLFLVLFFGNGKPAVVRCSSHTTHPRDMNTAVTSVCSQSCATLSTVVVSRVPVSP